MITHPKSYSFPEKKCTYPFCLFTSDTVLALNSRKRSSEIKQDYTPTCSYTHIKRKPEVCVVFGKKLVSKSLRSFSFKKKKTYKSSVVQSFKQQVLEINQKPQWVNYTLPLQLFEWNISSPKRKLKIYIHGNFTPVG